MQVAYMYCTVQYFGAVASTIGSYRIRSDRISTKTDACVRRLLCFSAGVCRWRALGQYCAVLGMGVAQLARLAAETEREGHAVKATVRVRVIQLV